MKIIGCCVCYAIIQLSDCFGYIEVFTMHMEFVINVQFASIILGCKVQDIFPIYFYLHF